MTGPFITDGVAEIYGKLPKKIYFQLKGQADLVVKDWKPITPDALLINLQTAREAFDGVQPSWEINKESQKSQMQAIKEWLEAGNSITPLVALEKFGCFRLSAQIFNLKKLGLKIECKNDKDPRTGKRYGTYTLVKENPHNEP